MTCRSLSQMTWSRSPMTLNPPGFPDTRVRDDYTLSSRGSPGGPTMTASLWGGAMAIGVIGLGNIGRGIATNLVADGNDVVVHDLDAAAMAAIEGATAAPDVATVAKAADVTLLSLPTPEVVSDVAAAWSYAAAPGAVLVDLSTNSPAVVRDLGARLATDGHHLVE